MYVYKETSLQMFTSTLFIYGCTGSSLLPSGFLRLQHTGLLNVVGSLVSEHGLQSAGSVIVVNRLQLLCGMWDLPRPGIEPLLPALAGRFSTRGPPGESHSHVIHRCFQQVNGHELCIYTMEYYLIKRRNC